jgi:hypothetical protein
MTFRVETRAEAEREADAILVAVMERHYFSALPFLIARPNSGW